MTTTLNRQVIGGGRAVRGERNPARYDVVVIGGGQAGLATGYHLARHKLQFVILDASERVGDAWRKRWDSLHVFSPARYDGLPGVPFPAPPHSFPSKDDIADYLETYAHRMNLPVRSGVRVERLTRTDNGYVAEAGATTFEAPQVVIATGAYQLPRVPDFGVDLDPEIRQLHSSEYRNPAQLQDGPVLIVGASNSGAEIAKDIAHAHQIWLSGRDTGKIPIHPNSRAAQHFDRVFWFAANHILTLNSPLGRKARPYMRDRGAPLERVKPADLAAAGVERVYVRTVGVRDGLPLLADGRVLSVTNVIWCTGFRQDYDWIELPVIGEDGWPVQKRGVVSAAPGLYFVGLPFMHSFASPLIGGVGRDAAYVADTIAAQTGVRQSTLTSVAQ